MTDPVGAEYAARVEAMADALHEDCRLEWQAIAVVDPSRQITMHGPDAHYGRAHDLVRRLFPEADAAATLAPLDVDVLARALGNVLGRTEKDHLPKLPLAEVIAAEYNRLAAALSPAPPPEEPAENVELLRRLDAWTGAVDPGPLIRWAAAHLRGCLDAAPPALADRARLVEENRRLREALEAILRPSILSFEMDILEEHRRIAGAALLAATSGAGR